MAVAKILLAGLVLAVAALPAAAEQGITDDSVTFAQVAALEGSAAALGGGMRTGILAAFEEANRAGGVHDRTVALESFDDGYEPDRAVREARRLVGEDAHIGFIGSVGTPTAAATQPIATEAGIPIIGAFTGAGFLRNAELGNVFNLRASYGAETEAWIAHLVDTLGMKRIAILYQDDSFGMAGYTGATAALEKRGMTLVAEGVYRRNTTAVKTALVHIRRAKPDAVVMVGAYLPVAKFIKVAAEIDFAPTFVNISFVGSDALASELGAAGASVIISQVVPFPQDASVPVVADYQAALAAVDPAAEPGFVSLEGYLVGRMTLAALEKAGTDLTREGLTDAFAGLGTVDIGGVTLSFGPGDNQGMDAVFLTRITDDGGFEPMN